MTRRVATYRAFVSTGATRHTTLWTEGRRPGRLVVNAAGFLVLVVVLADLLAYREITVLFDVAFVLVCIGAALAVRPRDFFVVGVLPPLLMAGTMALLAALVRGEVADPRDGFLQAWVSGLAHHSSYLVVGYGLTLCLLALRQIAVKNSGPIRSRARTPVSR